MPNIKLSQINPAPGPPAATDTLIGVLGGNTDAQVSLSQVEAAVNRGSGIFNIEDFGAVADGVTDNTASIQAAINAAMLVKGDVIIPATVLPFVFKTQLQIVNGACAIRGKGTWNFHGGVPSGPQLKFVNAGFGTDLFLISNSLRTVFSNFTLDCSAGAPTNGTAFNFQNCQSAQFEDMLIYGCWNGIFIDNCTSARLYRLQIQPQPAAGIGIYITNQQSLTAGGVYTLEDIIIFPSTGAAPNVTGFQFGKGTGSMDIRFCFANACLNGWVFLTEDNTTGPSSNSPGIIDMWNCGAEANTGIGFFFKAAYDINVVDIYCNINQGIGVQVDQGCFGLNIVGGQIMANFQHGINLTDNCRDIHLNSVYVADNGTSLANTYNGVNVAAGAQHFSVTDCRLGGVAQFTGGTTGNQKNGVSINIGNGASGNPCDFYFINSNDTTGNLGPGIVDNGSGTHKQVTNNLGYNPVGISAPVNVGASPATITAGSSPETHYVRQAATNTATVAKGGQTIATLAGASTYYVVELAPMESYVVTWLTTQPTFTRDVH